MLLAIHPDNPESRKIDQVVSIIEKGGIIIYPTDSVYAMGCDMGNIKAAQQMSKLKDVKPKEAKFSLICSDLSQASEYTYSYDRSLFKLLNRNLPGPFTFIMKASKKVSEKLSFKRSQIGIRVPDHPILQAITERLGRPLLSTSIHHEDEILEYMTDPYLIHETFEHQVDVVIDGGMGSNEASTVVLCLDGDIEIIRQGQGELID